MVAEKSFRSRACLYQGHKIVWWWPQGGTALSAGEVGQGYREVDDPSVYVRFPLVDDADGKFRDTDLLVWTTTPWTLPSNQFAAVKPELEYSVVELEGDPRRLLMASALVETIAAKVQKDHRVLSTLSGQEIVGRRYVPPFDFYWKDEGQTQGQLKEGGQQHVAWRVVPADFVTIATGTGIVHQAPAFGEVDYDVLLEEQERFVGGQGPPLVCAVAPDGTFTAEAPDYQGRWVKDADREIVRKMRDDGTLLHQEQFRHDYPFCWRADDDPLIQYPRKSWFVRTTRFKDQMLENNGLMGWHPEHIRDGRFGNFLETNVDWALSRERYWGTPLPIWVCEETGQMEVVASYDELCSKPGLQGTEVWAEAKKAHPHLPDDLRIHKPYIDAVTYDSPAAPGKRMRRVPEVIDCWFDAGSMPFAQWGYPHQKGSAEQFADQFPADFISEALDQTRGWFYSLVAISTLLFSEEEEFPHPFRNCVVLGFILGEDGGKMSKQKRNYREPQEIFDRYGADALRWYFFSNQPPWTSIRYSEQSIRQAIPEFLLRLWNVYSFFVIYANIDKFDAGAAIAGEVGQVTPQQLAAAEAYRPVSERGELDRWILSELNRTTAGVVEAMDGYDNFTACARLTEFVDALSNWYVRRSRARFWTDEPSADKSDAHWTLYECLLTTSKLVAPFVPFVADAMWQNLAVAAFSGRAAPSVHLCDYPAADDEVIDEDLSQRMALVREIASLGRSARMNAKLKVRQPLSQVEVVLADETHRSWLEEHASLICEELNVKAVEFIREADQYITYTVLPDLKRLGPRLGKRLPALRKLLAETDGSRLLAELEADGKVTLELPDGPVELDREDLQVRLQAKEGWAAAQGRSCVVVLSTEISDDLVLEGLAREVAHAVNVRRREIGCEYTDRIILGIVTESAELRAAVEQFADYIQAEALAAELTLGPVPDAEGVDLTLGGHALTLFVKVRQP